MAYIATMQDSTGTTFYPQIKKDGVLDWPTNLATTDNITKVYETQITANNGQVIQFKRIGNVVIANFYQSSSKALAAWASLGTIPVGYTNGYYEVSTVLENLNVEHTVVVTFQTSTNDIIVRDVAMQAKGSYLGEAVWFTKDSVPAG